MTDPVRLMRAMFDAAIASAQAETCVPPWLPDPTEVKGRLIVIGAGKASAAMARAVEDHWRGALSGLVITRYGYEVPCDRIEIVAAAHPVPDEAGLRATRCVLELVRGLRADDVVLCLISGGGSALLTLPLEGLTLADAQQIHRALLASGAPIGEMNTVRRHLSAVKGGRLAAACHPARVVTLMISDVPGDRPLDIASGPTVGDPTTCADALAVVRRRGIDLPTRAIELLTSGAGESVKPDDERLRGTSAHVVAAPQQALQAAAEVAAAAGYTPCILGDAIEGEAHEVGRVLAGIALQVARHGQPARPPCALLSGGETTVTLRRSGGRGGRNVECLLALALALQGQARIHALMGDTDGVDGVEEIAGGWIAPQTLARAAAASLGAEALLDGHDAHTFFQRLGQSVITGPTQTNVNDFRVILIDA